MKKTFLLLIIILAFNLPSCAFEPIPVQLGEIENSLWGFEYKKENDQNRLKRIEDNVFGVVDSKSTIQERINKINQALGLENDSTNDKIAKDLEEIEGRDVAYPVIDKLETEFLKKSFQNEGIYTRLERLEKEVYGTKQNGELSDRVERLVGSSTINSRQASSKKGGNSYDPTQPQSYYDSYDADIQLQIAGLENSMFGKVYTQDPMGLRLNRLERKVFQRDFAGDDEFTRFQRLQAASTAKNTSRLYDGNKIQKYTSTGIQIGTILLMILAFIL